MKSEEIYNELQMSYEQLIAYLLNKYGGAKCDYFATPECNSKSKKISRTKEGLYCHHMDEDKGAKLSDTKAAKMQPFEWQKKERLVYCNILEHLILHIKIAVIRQKSPLKKPENINDFFTTGGIFAVCNDINDMFSNEGTSVAYKKRCFEEIKDNYNDYIAIIKALLIYIEENYNGIKDEPVFLKIGTKVHFSDGDREILKLSKKRDAVLLKASDGTEKAFYTAIISNQLTYADQIDINIRRMATGYDMLYDSIYEDILNFNNKNVLDIYVKALYIDYKEFGYSQYANISLSENFGAKNADEYISKALPMHCDLNYELKNKKPVFWTGCIPLDVEYNDDLFFIVRIKTMFDIKEGQTPFVRYRETDFLRNHDIFTISEIHNFRNYGWTVLKTSDIYDKKTAKYYSKYINLDKKVVDATVILSLGKDDYRLFKKRYNIRYFEILDGCYFK